MLLIAFVALYGASNGVMTIVRAVMPAELFGRDILRRDQRRAVRAGDSVSRSGADRRCPAVVCFGNYAVVLWVLVGLALAAGAGFALATRA